MDVLAALLRGEPLPWTSSGMSPDEFLDACRQEDLEGLIYHRLAGSGVRSSWPADIFERLATLARIEAAQELVRGVEIGRVLETLASQAAEPIVLKGTALAYTVYPSPASRPRSDTDLLIRADLVDVARRVLAELGYRTTAHCSELFHQFEVQKVDELGVQHVFDVHWGISTQPVFAELLTYDELRAESQPIPALGARVRGAATAHALLLACVHPVMHHRNAERLLWMYDVHLLASLLTPAEFVSFAEAAAGKRMVEVCARALTSARGTLRTAIPDAVFERLRVVPGSEPSSAYLQQGRRWHDELASSIRGLATPRERARLLREVLFPSSRYMRSAYGINGGWLGTLMLPALYVHRNAFGAWKILAGRK